MKRVGLPTLERRMMGYERRTKKNDWDKERRWRDSVLPVSQCRPEQEHFRRGEGGKFKREQANLVSNPVLSYLTGTTPPCHTTEAKSSVGLDISMENNHIQSWQSNYV